MSAEDLTPRDNQDPPRDNQGRDLRAVQRAIDRQADEARLGREASSAHHEAVVRDVPLADWVDVRGQQVLRCGNHRHVALPRTGRQSAGNFDIFDLDAGERVVTLRRDEVREWLWRAAKADFEAQHGRPPGVPAAPAPHSQPAQPAAAADTAVSAEPDGQEDYLLTLFGVDANAVQTDPFQVLWDSAQADVQRRQQELQRLRDAIRAQIERAVAEHDAWAARVYKANRAQVELRGDGPSRQATMSIGGINESRRQHALQALAEEIGALQQLADAMATPQGQERVMHNLRGLMARASAAVESGNWRGHTLQGMFESMLLEDLKVRGPAGKGSVQSNGLSRALWKALQDLQAFQEGQQDRRAQAPHAPESPSVLEPDAAGAGDGSTEHHVARHRG